LLVFAWLTEKRRKHIEEEVENWNGKRGENQTGDLPKREQLFSFLVTVSEW